MIIDQRSKLFINRIVIVLSVVNIECIIRSEHA